ncbi:MAG: hypothetical protein KGL39_15395 [Patescibacteria group bacterium]|nr:hypothetical protein [Patescibacteria group bacterium]
MKRILFGLLALLPLATVPAFGNTTLGSDNFAYSGTLNATYWSALSSDGLSTANSGVVQSSSGNTAGLYTGSPTISWPNDQWAQVTIKVANTDSNKFVGVLLRGSTSVLTTYRIYVSGPLGSSATVTIAKSVAGTFTIITSTTHTVSANDVLYATVIGTTLTAYINGSQVLQTTDSSIAAGIPGLTVGQNSTATDAQGATWSGGNFLSALNGAMFLVVP